MLTTLQAQGCTIGILTRNSRENAFVTLAACDLDQFFAPEFVLSRHCCAPKPSPDGILQLLDQWNAPAARSVMVGDYLFDLQAGRRAGSATIYLDPTGTFEWQDHADLSVITLAQITTNL